MQHSTTTKHSEALNGHAIINMTEADKLGFTIRQKLFLRLKGMKAAGLVVYVSNRKLASELKTTIQVIKNELAALRKNKLITCEIEDGHRVIGIVESGKIRQNNESKSAKGVTSQVTGGNPTDYQRVTSEVTGGSPERLRGGNPGGYSHYIRDIDLRSKSIEDRSREEEEASASSPSHTLHDDITTCENSKPKRKKKKGELPEDLDLSTWSHQATEALKLWAKYRQELGKPLTATSFYTLVKKYTLDQQGFIEASEYTIEMGWQGLRAPEKQHKQQGRGRPNKAQQDEEYLDGILRDFVQGVQ